MKVSTTTSCSDWCAVGEDEIHGVVDLEAESEGEVLAVGEVESTGEGLYQLLTAMLTMRCKLGYCIGP